MSLKLVGVLVCGFVIVAAQVSHAPPPGPTGPIKPVTNSTSKPTTTVTTPKTTTISTSKPTTPTTKTTTTSTTPASTTSTSTTSTSTTPAPAPTTTPQPPVGPPVNTFKISYSNSSNYCLLMNVSLEIEVSGTNTTNSTKLDVPLLPITFGSCSPDSGKLQISWGTNSIEFHFEETKAKKYDFNIIYVTVGSDLYIYNKTAFPARVSESYKCDKVQTLDLAVLNNSTTKAAQLHLSHLQYQAFTNSSKQEFNTAWDCSGVNTPDVVPIVVGCVLAVLVILVLGAYLYGRKRWNASGYLSM